MSPHPRTGGRRGRRHRRGYHRGRGNFGLSPRLGLRRGDLTPIGRQLLLPGSFLELLGEGTFRGLMGTHLLLSSFLELLGEGTLGGLSGGRLEHEGHLCPRDRLETPLRNGLQRSYPHGDGGICRNERQPPRRLSPTLGCYPLLTLQQGGLGSDQYPDERQQLRSLGTTPKPFHTTPTKRVPRTTRSRPDTTRLPRFHRTTCKGERLGGRRSGL